jgi:HipA-like protein
MMNPASQPHEVGHLIGAAREAERVCQADAADTVGVSNLLRGHLEHGAPSAGVDKTPPALKGFGTPSHAGVLDEAITHPAVSLRRTLQVFVHGTHIGDLHNESDVWSFCYARKWVSDANRRALAPGIPLLRRPIVDSGSIRPVQQYFESLLPDARMRTSLAELAQVDAADSFSLLAYWGEKLASYSLGDYPDFIQFCPPPDKISQTASRR